MCGRFAQALPPRDYVDVVDEQVNDKRRGGGGRPSWQRGGGEKDGSSQQSRSQGQASDKSVDSAKIVSKVQETDYYPTHNVAPGVRVPVVRMETPQPMTGYGGESDGKAQLTDDLVYVQAMRWGLLPHYTTAIPRGADAMRTINARDDAVLSGRSMWTPILRAGKRCVVFCQGFYEWQKKDDGAQRIAHFVGMRDAGHGRTDVKGEQRALMPMAGLWEKCSIDGEDIYSFTIITTESNHQLTFLHDRMPVILPNHEAIQIWLGIQSASNEYICSLLKPYDAGKLDCYTVPREVGRVGTDDQSFILPVASRKDGIAAAFSRAQKSKAASSPKKDDINSESNAPFEEETKALNEAAAEHSIGHQSRSIERDDARLAEKMQAEEERAASSGTKRKRRESSTEEQDAALAQRLQDDEDSKVDKVSKLEVPEEDRRSFASETSNRKPASSRFSPEPYNPPVSPPRPKGGYSTVDNPDPSPYKRTMHKDGHRGVGGSPPKSRSNGANAVKQKQLQEAAKGSKDIRSFF